MKYRTPLALLVGAVLGGVLGWLLFTCTIDRDDTAQGVAYSAMGVMSGLFMAMLVLTKGTCDFTKKGRDNTDLVGHIDGAGTLPFISDASVASNAEGQQSDAG